MGLSCHDCNDALKKYRGCNDKPIQPYLVDDKPLDRCPAKSLPIEIKEYIRYYSYYKKGRNLFSGGIMSYPVKLLQIFDILESAEIEAEKNRQDKLFKQ